MNDATGGAWYVLNNTPNGLPDADGRVLFMQITTAGEVSGTMNVQIFENGVGSESIYNTYDFSGVGEFSTGGVRPRTPVAARILKRITTTIRRNTMTIAASMQFLVALTPRRATTIQMLRRTMALYVR